MLSDSTNTKLARLIDLENKRREIETEIELILAPAQDVQSNGKIQDMKQFDASKCCILGCENKLFAKGFCQRHYKEQRQKRSATEPKLPGTPRGEIMTDKQFTDVKIAKGRGDLTSKDVADKMQLGIEEVNKAFIAFDYKDYLRRS